MESDEDHIWVVNTPTATELLPHMLERFRLGHLDPLIFGDTTEPEGVIVPFKVWQARDARALDYDGGPVDNSTPE
ncbi:hypothetical protein AB0E63_36910 [Kribbella sp. NPDC026596]|uniref:hypothetical protein n=1 Tax=Kribbella sp. NPDC026596 TaxID=3155122 RepID=UPI0033D9FBB9